jgi:hypothetical protein
MNMYLPIILAVLSLIERGAAALPKLRAAARRTGELTPEQDAELDARMETAFKSDAFKTDDELAAPGEPPPTGPPNE